MVTYAANELIPSSVFAKQFGSYLTQIRDGVTDKLAILKNNKVEAVLVSKDEYERMQGVIELLEELEDQEIMRIAEERLSKPYKTISHEEMMKRLNIDPKELEE
jgi:PHD/YefM family antitoxin component YafN of YafNO toxin-antitoxin module